MKKDDSFASELFFDETISKDKYDILKSWIDAGVLYTASVEILHKKPMLRLNLSFVEDREDKNTANGVIKKVVTPIGALLFDITISEKKYNILKTCEKTCPFFVSEVELLNNFKIHIAVAFGKIKMGKVVIPNNAFGFVTTLTVMED